MNAEYYVENSEFRIYRLPMTDSQAHISSSDTEVATSILDSARRRFERYGFNKTTMAEIASDCGMSAANIYRYFPNKGAIAAAGASGWMAHAQDKLARIARDDSVPPPDRLRAFLQAHLVMVAELMAGHSHLDELVNHVCEARPDLLAGHIHANRAEIARILADGVSSGDFAVSDPNGTAAAIQSATVCFRHHSFIRPDMIEELKRDLNRVVDLLFIGLLVRAEEG